MGGTFTFLIEQIRKDHSMGMGGTFSFQKLKIRKDQKSRNVWYFHFSKFENKKDKKSRNGWHFHKELGKTTNLRMGGIFTFQNLKIRKDQRSDRNGWQAGFR